MRDRSLVVWSAPEFEWAFTQPQTNRTIWRNTPGFNLNGPNNLGLKAPIVAQPVVFTYTVDIVENKNCKEVGIGKKKKNVTEHKPGGFSRIVQYRHSCLARGLDTVKAVPEPDTKYCIAEHKKCIRESLKKAMSKMRENHPGGFQTVESWPFGDSRFLQGTVDWQVTNKPRRLSVAWLRSDRPSLRQPVLSNAVSKYQANYC